jgi:hypothetical protein
MLVRFQIKPVFQLVLPINLNRMYLVLRWIMVSATAWEWAVVLVTPLKVLLETNSVESTTSIAAAMF